jgi:hypothetical protein
MIRMFAADSSFDRSPPSCDLAVSLPGCAADPLAADRIGALMAAQYGVATATSR